MDTYLAKYGEAFDLYGIKLITAGSLAFKANPTLASGDVKISKDGGALTNLATLPDAVPASSTEVHVALSAGELTCRIATINFIDAAGSEWENKSIQVLTYGHPMAYLPFDFSTAAVSLLQPQVAQIVDGVWDATRDTHTAIGSFGESVRFDAAERTALTNAILDEADTVETGVALRGALRLILASAAGITDGSGTNTFTLRNAVANTKVRMTATVSNQGNRLAIVYDLT